ncbi:3-dehydroquinate synthase [Pseudalkalibacillus decolorationis]|uniref:3-dehydroquinate synthase n=1 Tax=Pseudalkalibacillus decolorationis TaxID=163879 RepID=UPI0021481C0C|nr:3-dehydroquinate synthase [Pseudalkalibacillus decolorationis]
METLAIQTKSKQYPLYLGNDSIHILSSLISDLTPAASSIFIISDSVVSNHYMNHVKSCIPNDKNVFQFVIPAGEEQKSFENYYACQTYALECGLDRNSLVLAFGGGVIGDFAGFIAATYMRGIRFIQIPTTLLAHDSAVGGKVAINHPLGKNMIGVFHQPEAVIYNLSFLDSLPEQEWRSGFAEVIKHSFISKQNFFEWLQMNVHSLNDLQHEKLHEALKKAISVKANVIFQDETEQGVRAHLNFGHTLGHAIEAELGYGSITHGDAIAIGMQFALLLSEKVFQKDLQFVEKKTWFESYGYPKLPAHLTAEQLLERMKRDKKTKSGTIRMVLLKEIGCMQLVEISDESIKETLHEFIDSNS